METEYRRNNNLHENEGDHTRYDLDGDDDTYYHEEDTPTAPIPGYMRPNFTSLLPEYANAETDQIRSAFSTNNFTSLLKLPPKLAPNAVTQARFEQMDENRLLETKTSSVTPKIVTKNGLFNQFEYTPSRFSLADELAQMERLESDAKRLAISGKDFVSPNDAQKLKYEDAFGGTQSYPHLQEPYPDVRDELRHAKWLEDQKILHGAFVPSGYRPPVDAITRLVLPELLTELHEVLAKDWSDVEFTICVTEDDNVAVRFSEATLDCVEPGLIAYMNVFVKTHRVASKYKLKKVAEDWNAKPGDGGLYFVVRPPWTKNRSRDMILLTSTGTTTSTTRK